MEGSRITVYLNDDKGLLPADNSDPRVQRGSGGQARTGGFEVLGGMELSGRAATVGKDWRYVPYEGMMKMGVRLLQLRDPSMALDWFCSVVIQRTKAGQMDLVGEDVYFWLGKTYAAMGSSDLADQFLNSLLSVGDKVGLSGILRGLKGSPAGDVLAHWDGVRVELARASLYGLGQVANAKKALDLIDCVTGGYEDQERLMLLQVVAHYTSGQYDAVVELKPRGWRAERFKEVWICFGSAHYRRVEYWEAAECMLHVTKNSSGSSWYDKLYSRVVWLVAEFKKTEAPRVLVVQYLSKVVRLLSRAHANKGGVTFHEGVSLVSRESLKAAQLHLDAAMKLLYQCPDRTLYGVIYDSKKLLEEGLKTL